MEQKIIEMLQKMDNRLDGIEREMGSMKSEMGSMKSEMGSMKSEMGSMKSEINKRFDSLEGQLMHNSNWIHTEIVDMRKDISSTQNIKKLYSEEALKAVEAV